MKTISVNTRWIFVLIIAIALYVIGIGAGAAATLTVDDSGGADYMRIQDAINNASTGDTILVYSGTYYENVNVTKQLTIRSSGTTVIPQVETTGAIIQAQIPMVMVLAILLTISTEVLRTGTPLYR